MSQFNILMVLVNHRNDSAKQVQGLLTKYGCNIKTRLGLHQTGEFCANDGLILLELDDKPDDISVIKRDLDMVDGVKTQLVSLSNDE